MWVSIILFFTFIFDCHFLRYRLLGKQVFLVTHLLFLNSWCFKDVILISDLCKVSDKKSDIILIFIPVYDGPLSRYHLFSEFDYNIFSYSFLRVLPFGVLSASLIYCFTSFIKFGNFIQFFFSYFCPLLFPFLPNRASVTWFYFFNLFIFKAMPCNSQDLSSLTRYQTPKWKWGVLTTGPPWNSHHFW